MTRRLLSMTRRLLAMAGRFIAMTGLFLAGRCMRCGLEELAIRGFSGAMVLLLARGPIATLTSTAATAPAATTTAFTGLGTIPVRFGRVRRFGIHLSFDRLARLGGGAGRARLLLLLRSRLARLTRLTRLAGLAGLATAFATSLAAFARLLLATLATRLAAASITALALRLVGTTLAIATATAAARLLLATAFALALLAAPSIAPAVAAAAIAGTLPAARRAILERRGGRRERLADFHARLGLGGLLEPSEQAVQESVLLLLRLRRGGARRHGRCGAARRGGRLGSRRGAHRRGLLGADALDQRLGARGRLLGTLARPADSRHSSCRVDGWDVAALE